MTARSNEHAPLAPSSAHIWVECPGSVDMQARMPEQDETDESREGTAAHWLLEQTLLKLTVPDDAIAPNGVPINQEMRDCIVELVTDINDTLNAGCQGGDYYQVEQRVYAHQSIHPDNDGTPDCYFVQHSKRTVHIWDYKHGHRFVDAFRWWQGINYAAAIVETEQIVDWQDWTFTLTIAQPRCYTNDELGRGLREWFTDGRTLAPYFDKLRVAAHEARSPSAICRTGEHCLDCTAAFDCAANNQMSGKVLDVAYRQMSLSTDPQSLGLMGKFLSEAEDRLVATRKAYDARIQSLLSSGQRVPWHQIGWSQPRTGWDKARQAEVASLCAMFGIDVQPGVALPTPAQCIKQGVDESVITPYITRNSPAQKLLRVDETNAEKVFGRRG